MFIKNSLKLFLLGLITPLLCGVSFGFDLTADEVSYLDNNALNIGNFSNVSNYVLYHNDSNAGQNICVIFSGLVFSQNPHYFTIMSTDNQNMGDYYSTNSFSSYPYYMYCLSLDTQYSYLKILKANASSMNNLKFSVDKFWAISADKIINGYLGFDVQSLLDNYDTCSNNLNQCDTSVQQCQIDKESLSGSLASCNSDKNSLQNYNDSLTEQLNQCLNDNLSGDFASGGFLRYSMFWQDNDSMFSLPITNDLFLPNGYKGKLDEDNVLSIAKLNTLEASYQFSEEDKITIIDLLSMVMLFLLATGSLIGIILFLKRLIIKK